MSRWTIPTTRQAACQKMWSRFLDSTLPAAFSREMNHGLIGLKARSRSRTPKDSAAGKDDSGGALSQDGEDLDKLFIAVPAKAILKAGLCHAETAVRSVAESKAAGGC